MPQLAPTLGYIMFISIFMTFLILTCSLAKTSKTITTSKSSNSHKQLLTYN
uniref:ATP synthase complex subunit 8 n=1 Tax=Onchidella borealis TaxID=244421 RepID=E6Y1C6_9EUPU|nr:ATP synthase F0 subunit 8 [Onchidella borealis]